MVELKTFSELPRSTSFEIKTYTPSPYFYKNRYKQGKLKNNFISHWSDQLELVTYKPDISGSVKNDRSDGMANRLENVRCPIWVRVLGLFFFILIIFSIMITFITMMECSQWRHDKTVLGILFFILSLLFWCLIWHFIFEPASGSGSLEDSSSFDK